MDGVVRVLPTGASNIYLVRGSDGYAVVDTGMSGDRRKLAGELGRFGVDPGDVKLIILTHSHGDHTGGLAALKAITGAPVLCHAEAAPFLASGKGSPAVPRTIPGKILNALLPEMKREPVVADLTFEDSFDLSRFGIAGRAVSMPGHSRDSIIVVLDTGETIVGDQFRGKPGSLTLGMFYEDERELRESIGSTADLNAEVLYMSHGTETDNADLRRFLAGLDA